LYKRLSYNPIVIDKLIVEVIEAEKGLDAFYSIRRFLVIYRLNLLRVNFNFFYPNDKPKVFYSFYSKFVFFLILTYRPIFRSLSRTFLT